MTARVVGRVCRTELEDGSQGVLAGVRRALRFCVIESSIVDLERRRKSEQYQFCLTGSRDQAMITPLRALSLKQN